jgi:hypothetical protein
MQYLYWKRIKIKYLGALSDNENAIHLLEKKNIDEIPLCRLSENPNAIALLEKNKDEFKRIDSKFKEGTMFSLSRNPNIFTLNYKSIEERINIYKEELMMTVFHPKRFWRYLNMGYNLGDDSYENVIVM